MTMLFNPFEELDRLSRTVLGTAPGMPVDFYRDGDRYVLQADLPGIDPASVDVQVDENGLAVEAIRSVEAPEGAQWLAQERPSLRFVRRFRVGDGIDIERINATYADGVLTVEAPVTERAKPRRIHVEVQPAVPAGTEQAGSGQRSVEGSKGPEEDRAAEAAAAGQTARA